MVPGGPRLQIFDVAEVAARVEAAGKPDWLIEGLWPADAHGVLGATYKAGKSWAVDDLAVSCVTGTPWLGHFPTLRGACVMFLGEGGDRATLRRLDAIAEGRGLTRGELTGLRLCFAVPRLLSDPDLREVAAELERGPRVVILDPLYLAAAGARGADLYAMGEALGRIQQLCQAAHAGLVITTHWNQTGEGTGAARFTGAGPSAWGRVLGSGAVEQDHTDGDGASTVLVRWEFTGGEILGTAFRMRRRVWADDRADLASPMHYDVEVSDAELELPPGAAGLTFTQQRVLDTLGTDPSTDAVTVRDIGDAVAHDGRGYPLQARTIQKALNALADKGLADGESGEKPTDAARWWRL